MSQKIQDKLLLFITNNFMIERQEINLDKSIIDEGIIDSFGLIEIAAFIEQEFHIPIGEEQMNRSNFESVHKIVDFITREIE